MDFMAGAAPHYRHARLDCATRGNLVRPVGRDCKQTGMGHGQTLLKPAPVLAMNLGEPARQLL